jgi:peptidyl-Asp metalloendopeptidase
MRRIWGIGLALAGFVVTVAHAQDGRDLFVERGVSAVRTGDSVQAEKRVRAAPGTEDVRVTSVRASLLSDSGKDVVLNLPGATLTATGSVTSRNGENLTWVGTIAGELLSSVVLVVRDGTVTGEVRAKSGVFRVTPLDRNDHAVSRVDESKLPPDDDEPPARKKPSRASKRSGQAADREQDAPAKIHALRVLVAYTSDVEAHVSDMGRRMEEITALSNMSFERSDVRIRLEIADVYKTAYRETGKAAKDVRLNEVLNRRWRHKADIAVLIVSKLVNEKGKSICGRARSIGATYPDAFAVVRGNCVQSFAHEIGHLLGTQHNWEKDRRQDLVCGTYGHGVYSLAGGWRTMMAYACDPPASGACTRYWRWSNPLIKDDNGAPLGHEKYANEAKCLNEGISRFCSGPAPCARD